MAKTVEVFYTIQNGQPSIKFHIAEEVEGAAKEKVIELLKDLPLPGGVIDSLSAVPPARFLPSNEVEVNDVPNKRFAGQKTISPQSGNNIITDKQLWCIQEHLKKEGTDESEFCLRHGVKRLEDLPKGMAIKIIKGIKNNG